MFGGQGLICDKLIALRYLSLFFGASYFWLNLGCFLYFFGQLSELGFGIMLLLCKHLATGIVNIEERGK